MYYPPQLAGRSPNDSPLAAAVLLSAGLHVLLGGLILIVMPHLARQIKPEDILTVQLMGSLTPPAPAAQAAPVDPSLKMPDVVEAPRADPALSQPAPPEPLPLAAPAEVIPLGPKAPVKPPVIKKTPAVPPKVTPPKVAAEPPPKPKPRPNNDAAINNRLEALRRKVEAEKLDAEIDSRIVNIAKAQGTGEGEGRDESGGAGDSRINPEKQAYYNQVKKIIADNWLLPPGAEAAGLQASFAIRVAPGGQVIAQELQGPSGDAGYDLSVEQAIGRSVLPPLPAIFGGQPYDVGFVFTPRDKRL